VGLLAERLPVSLLPNPKVREPLAFALLAYLHAQGQVNVLGRATGGRDIRAGMRVEPG
jgi:anhydro-N-acetylmuramic acid kinase